MLIPNHPDDERLSALAWHDADAAADTKLTLHVSSCDRCAALVNELGALRAVLADLPDVAPSRPLRFIPPVEDAPPNAAGAGPTTTPDEPAAAAPASTEGQAQAPDETPSGSGQAPTSSDRP